MMEEVRLRYCDASELQGIASSSSRRLSGDLIYVRRRRCSSTGPTLYHSCSMDVKYGPLLEKRLDAFDTWYLRKILRIPYTRHSTNGTVRSITGCLPVSDRVKSFRMRFHGHLARSAPEEDHHCDITAALRPPTDWRRPVGRPRATCLRTIDKDVQSLNFGGPYSMEEGKR